MWQNGETRATLRAVELNEAQQRPTNNWCNKPSLHQWNMKRKIGNKRCQERTKRIYSQHNWDLLKNNDNLPGHKQHKAE